MSAKETIRQKLLKNINNDSVVTNIMAEYDANEKEYRTAGSSSAMYSQRRTGMRRILSHFGVRDEDIKRYHAEEYGTGNSRQVINSMQETIDDLRKQLAERK